MDRLTGKLRVERFNLGKLLILLGGFVLLANIGVFNMVSLVSAAVLAVGGGLLGRLYLQRGGVWALLITFALFGAAATVLSPFLPGAQFLALFGVGFAVVYLRDRTHWWAIIPAGVLITLAVLVSLATLAPPLPDAPLLFFGIAATFVLLYKLPEGGQAWAAYPAIAAVAVALLSSSFTNTWVLPLLFLGGGVTLLVRRKDRTPPGPRTMLVPAPDVPDSEAQPREVPQTTPGGVAEEAEN